MAHVILGADAIHAPLTGIGRYAYELATLLPQCEAVESLRFYSLGQWVTGDAVQARAKTVSTQELNKPTLRRVLAGNKLAVRAYSALMPIWSQWRMKQERHTLFHSPNYFLPPFPGKSVATIHDLSHIVCPQFHPAARVELLKRDLPKSVARADFLITDAESVRREVIEHFGWPEDRIRTVPLGVDASFHPRSSTETQPVLQRHGLVHGAYSLYVGTIEPRKNLARLIRAYAELPESLRMHVPLVLAGSRGWQAQEIHELMTRGASAGWLRYLDFIPQEDLPFLYSGARLFCFPSLYEGFGLPPLEAMASGTPVLASNTSSLPEVVGDVGWKVEPEDERAISVALLDALQNDQWRSLASVAGVERSRAFTWMQCARSTSDIYSSLTRDGLPGY
ncbi:glycosyltransferase family 4 protein [Diaphorobacter aerolatus]|uniref:Glycosyltransferase family 4 protein n=1 Tax=Diaphorobacter aerolatus TaxID=1288495 RepID=A0A7H0GNK0_9BURK|nr:glycosyltransferase family 1 protein [Diaphorobacter aerolatus]QNP49866.1 glycosyltransferase family 4 protein [Diaphorobacter aerolatus]